MTDAEWLASDDPAPMLKFLQGRSGDRKLRLFAVSCCRRALNHLADEKWRVTVDVAERYADEAPAITRTSVPCCVLVTLDP
jgi:hypothetical protein